MNVPLAQRNSDLIKSWSDIKRMLCGKHAIIAIEIFPDWSTIDNIKKMHTEYILTNVPLARRNSGVIKSWSNIKRILSTLIVISVIESFVVRETT